MKHRRIPGTDINVSIVALGTWAIGGGPWWGASDDAESIRAIHTALDNGINLIDTAPVYGWGHSEEVVGKAIKGRRDDVVLATKCGLWWDGSRGTFHYSLDGVTISRDLRPESLTEELDQCLRRLQVDTIDIFQTHWQSKDPEKTPIADTMGCLMDMKQAGKIRAIGVSNVTIADMDAYRDAGQLSTCQPRYSMLDRTIEAEILPYCLAHNVATLVYSPLEQGLLTGKIGMDQTFTETEYRNNIPWYAPANRRQVLDMLEGWGDIIADLECTLSQLVIAWTAAQPGITSVLCGGRKSAHVKENAGAGELTLPDSLLERMRHDVESLSLLES